MNSEIQISIVLPVYNAENYIQQTINSVLRQTHSNFKLIVIDDCSTDETLSHVSRFAQIDSRVQLFPLEINSGGPAKPRNVGLELANGDFIAFIDSDDLWHESKLETQLAIMIECGLEFSCMRIEKFSVSPNLCSKPLVHKERQQLTHKKLLRKNIIATSGVMFSSKIRQGLKFSEKTQHVAIEDYIYWLKLHQSTNLKSARLGQRLVYYRKVKGSLSDSKLQMASKIWLLLGEIDFPESLSLRSRCYHFLCYVVLGLFYQAYE